MSATPSILTQAEWLALATTALADLSKGYPAKEIGGATGQGLDHLLRELVEFQRGRGIDDGQAWGHSDIAVLHQEKDKPKAPRVLVVVRSGEAYYVADAGVDVEVFDNDKFEADPNATPRIPPHFQDLAQVVFGPQGPANES